MTLQNLKLAYALGLAAGRIDLLNGGFQSGFLLNDQYFICAAHVRPDTHEAYINSRSREESLVTIIQPQAVEPGKIVLLSPHDRGLT